MLQLGVLGPLRVTRDGAPVDVGGPRQRAVLLRLLVARGAAVSVDRLLTDLWDGDPPPSGLSALQAYVSHLRRCLEPDRAPRTPAAVLVTAPPGYAVRLPALAVDAEAFEAATAAAAEQLAASDPPQALVRLEEALGAWRGDAYAEVADEPWAVPEVVRLTELRMRAQERRAELLLAVRGGASIVGELEHLVRSAPLREESWRLLALALYDAGRQGDALAALRRARDVLADELGLDPGPALRELEQAVLEQSVAVRRAPVVAAAAPVAAPAAVPAGPALVGRDAELADLVALAQEVPGRSAVAVVSGEAGAGKSSLLDALRARLAADGWTTALGRCPEEGAAPPAWGWVELVRALPTPDAPARSALAPLLDDAGDDVGADDVAARFRLSVALRDHLAATAARGPLLLVLDDVHRADDQSLHLLSRLAGELPPQGVLLVAAHRTGEGGEQVTAALADLAVVARRRVELGGLGADDVARLVAAEAGDAADAATVAAIAERTGGNPFYVQECARLLASEGALVATSSVPRGVVDVLRRRLTRLPADAVGVLRLAAVIGRDVDVELLVAAAEHPEETVLEALEAGVVTGLLVDAGPGAVRFAHVLVHDVLYDDQPALRRARAHERVARALEQLRPEDHSRLAHHFGLAGSSGSARSAVDHAAAAALVAERRFAHDAAIASWRQALDALDRLPSGGTDAERIGLYGGLLRAQARAGANVGARETRAAALAVAVRTGDDRLVEEALTAWTAPTPWQNRPYTDVDVAVIDVLERLLRTPALHVEDPARDPERTARRVRLLGALVQEVDGVVDVRRADSASREALELSAAVDDPLLRADAIGFRYHGSLPHRDVDERFALAAELQDLATAHDLVVHRLLATQMWCNSAAARLDVDGLRREAAAARAVAVTYDAPHSVDQTDALRACLLTVEGRHAEAAQAYAATAASMAAHGSFNAEALGAVGHVSLAIDLRDAGTLLPLAEALHGAMGPTLADLHALALAWSGRLDDARAVSAESPEHVEHEYWWSFHSAVRLLSTLATGRLDAAEQAGAVLEPYADTVAGLATICVAVGPVAQLLGDLDVALGRHRRARDRYAQALQVARTVGAPLWTARAAEALAGVGGDPAGVAVRVPAQATRPATAEGSAQRVP